MIVASGNVIAWGHPTKKTVSTLILIKLIGTAVLNISAVSVLFCSSSSHRWVVSHGVSFQFCVYLLPLTSTEPAHFDFAKCFEN